jgi:hypothetical protein
MDGAIDGKEGYKKTDHGPFLNMVYFVFPLGKCLILEEKRLTSEDLSIAACGFSGQSPRPQTTATEIGYLWFLSVWQGRVPDLTLRS